MRMLPLGLFVGTLLLYLATLTKVHTFDALSYVLSVERKPWQEVFHPHHLAYGPLGALALALGRALGFTGGAALPMQVINALAGALGAAQLHRVIARATGRADLGLAAALVLVSSYAYWYYAVEIEVYTVAALFLILCLGLMARERPPTLRDMALLGLAQGGATLFHQTNALICVPVLIWLLGQRQRQPRGLLQPGLPLLLLAYGAALGAMVILPYLWVGFGVSRFDSIAAFITWMTEYARTGWWGGPVTANTWARLGQGLSETLTPVGGGWIWLLLGVAAGGALLTRSTARPPSLSPMITALLVWLAVYGAFFTWWEPDNIEFWIAALPPLLLLLAIALGRLRPWHPLVLLVCGAALLQGGLNLGAIQRRGDPTTDLQRDIARALAASSTPADLLIVPDGLQELYLPYYERREQFVSLNQAIFDAGGDWGAACDLIQARVELARHAGATALIAEEALRPPPELLARQQISQPQVDACFAPYQSEVVALDLPPNVPRYMRLPFAQELADGPGWRLGATPLGWLAANMTDAQFAGGWQLVPGSDPSLTSPLLRIDTAAFQTLEIRMASATQARDAQVFFIGEDGRADEARALRWELRSGPDMQTYRLDLRGAPGWGGVVTRLRIDPVGVGDGGAIVVESIRLVR
jgi:Dolichyl-phosphate-mannose-protein mannosyltransferase